DRRGKAGRVLDVGVREGELGERRRGFDLHAVGGERRQRALSHRIEGALAQRAADGEDSQGHDYFSAAIGLTSTPTRSMSISQLSPGRIQIGLGLRAWPTPEGVPVKTISPGSSVMPWVT